MLSAPRRPPRRQPCTRPLLEATQIGVTVAKLKKSTDPQACRPCRFYRLYRPCSLYMCSLCIAPPPRCWGHLSTQSAPLCGPQVAELASRIVRVWKGQLAEHRDQTGGPKRPSHVAAAFRRRL